MEFRSKNKRIAFNTSSHNATTNYSKHLPVSNTDRTTKNSDADSRSYNTCIRIRSKYSSTASKHLSQHRRSKSHQRRCHHKMLINFKVREMIQFKNPLVGTGQITHICQSGHSHFREQHFQWYQYQIIISTTVSQVMPNNRKIIPWKQFPKYPEIK